MPRSIEDILADIERRYAPPKPEPLGLWGSATLPFKAALGLTASAGGQLMRAFDPEAYEEAKRRNMEEFGTQGAPQRAADYLKQIEALPGAGDVRHEPCNGAD